MPQDSFLVGLIGSGIGPSLSPALHEREAGRQGLRHHYRLIDIDRLGVGPEAVGDLVRAARDLGFDGLNITHPCKQLVIGHLDALAPQAEALGAVNTVVFEDGRAVEDVVAVARRFRAAGGRLLRVPANYYDDLAARYEFTDGELGTYRELGIRYDRDAGGAFPSLLHGDGRPCLLRTRPARRGPPRLRSPERTGTAGRPARRRAAGPVGPVTDG